MAHSKQAIRLVNVRQSWVCLLNSSRKRLVKRKQSLVCVGSRLRNRFANNKLSSKCRLNKPETKPVKGLQNWGCLHSNKKKLRVRLRNSSRCKPLEWVPRSVSSKHRSDSKLNRLQIKPDNGQRKWV